MKVFIIGTGNVATALGKAVLKAGHQITGVYGRNHSHASRLSVKLGCRAFSIPAKIPLTSDIYLLAISDDAIGEVAKELPSVKGVVAHTSGASSLNLLKRFKSHGVFYPVETISNQYPRSFKKVPICIEGNSEKTVSRLMSLASSISEEIYSLDSGQRAVLHVAAVFANNFTNYLLGISTGILAKNDLPASLINTLALSTVNNVFTKGAFASQTGPAVRNDVKTITHHLDLLKNNKAYQELYSLITRQIRNVHNKNKKEM